MTSKTISAADIERVLKELEREGHASAAELVYRLGREGMSPSIARRAIQRGFDAGTVERDKNLRLRATRKQVAAG